MAKYIDLTGLAELWEKIKAYAVKKSGGDSLTGDYTITGKLTATEGIDTASTIKANDSSFTEMTVVTSDEDKGVTLSCYKEDSTENPYLYLYNAETGEAVRLTGIVAPTDNNDAANKAYVDTALAKYQESPATVQGTGAISMTTASNKEYVLRDVTSLDLKIARGYCHGFVSFSNSFTNSSATLSVTGSGNTTLLSDGDKIVEAAAGELWEFSVRMAIRSVTDIPACIIWKNWSAV